jgi:hypothetical protein
MTDIARSMVGLICSILIIQIPLMVYAYRITRSKNKMYIYIFILIPIWFLSAGTIHEGSHYLGCLLRGTEVVEAQLIPPFWKGDFFSAYIVSAESSVFSVSAPYWMDSLLFLLGMALLGVVRLRHPFVKSLVFTLLLTRSLFDILTNYLGFVFWGFGDFAYLADNLNPALVHAAALFLIAVFAAGIGNRILSAGEGSAGG